MRPPGPAWHARAKGAAAVLTALLLAASLTAAAGGSASASAGAATPAARPDKAAIDVVAAARTHLGDAYAWGGTGPHAWDCSGLTSVLWRTVGHVARIPRVAADQQAWAVPLPSEQALPGDLVFFGDPVTHVGIYVGNGQIVDASSSRHQVVQRRLWTSAHLRYGRVPRPGMPPVAPWGPSPSASPSSGASPSTAFTPSPSASPSASARPRPSASSWRSSSPKPAATPSRRPPRRSPRPSHRATPAPSPTPSAPPHR